MTSVDERTARAQRAGATALLLHEAATCDDPARRAELLEQVILLNRVVAEDIAQPYRDRGVPIEDLRRVACEALKEAVLRFDPEVGVDLLCVAVPRIRAALRRRFREVGWTVAAGD